MKKIIENAALNTDKEIWRQPTREWTDEDGNDSGMEPYVFVTKDGGVGFNHYGTCVVMKIEDWVKLAKTPIEPEAKGEIEMPENIGIDGSTGALVVPTGSMSDWMEAVTQFLNRHTQEIEKMRRER